MSVPASAALTMLSAVMLSTVMVVVVASGADVSAVNSTGEEGLPAASLAITSYFLPSSRAGLTSTVKSPLAFAVAVPRTLPSLSNTVTVLPGSALPVTSVPVGRSLESSSVVTEFTTGVLGPRVSMVSLKASLGTLSLPDASVWVTVRLCSPCASGRTVTLQVPSVLTCALPKTVLPS